MNTTELARARLLTITLQSMAELARPTPALLIFAGLLLCAGGSPWILLPLLLAAALQLFLAWRLHLDASLFQALIDGVETVELDRWLAEWLRRPFKECSWDARVSGTLQLIRWYCLCSGVVWCCAVLALILTLVYSGL